MKNRKSTAGKKGVTGIAVAIIGAILLVVIVLTILIPIIFLKIHIVRVVEVQYGYSTADLTLLALLSDTDIYEKLSLYVADMEDNAVEGFDRDSVKSEVTSILDKLVPSETDTRCYKLSYAGGVIIPPENCDTEFSATADILLPYGTNNEKITLEIK